MVLINNIKKQKSIEPARTATPDASRQNKISNGEETKILFLSVITSKSMTGPRPNEVKTFPPTGIVFFPITNNATRIMNPIAVYKKISPAALLFCIISFT